MMHRTRAAILAADVVGYTRLMAEDAAATVAALALQGNLDTARALTARYLAMMPERTLASWRAENGYAGAAGAERYFEGLRLAGLPEG